MITVALLALLGTTITAIPTYLALFIRTGRNGKVQDERFDAIDQKLDDKLDPVLAWIERHDQWHADREHAPVPYPVRRR
jgi:uncharacterized membrane protein YdjX (TVP38/TMEM64 family)